MQELTFLKTKEAKQFLKRILEQWGADVTFLLNDFAFMLSSKEKIYMVSKGVELVDLTKLKLNSMGMYFADVRKGNLRLSIEGSQLVGEHATKNVVELNEDDLRQWFTGEDLIKKGEWTDFVILKYKKDFVGSGKYKDGMIFNFVPKTRRVKELIL